MCWNFRGPAQSLLAATSIGGNGAEIDTVLRNGEHDGDRRWQSQPSWIMRFDALKSRGGNKRGVAKFQRWKKQSSQVPDQSMFKLCPFEVRHPNLGFCMLHSKCASKQVLIAKYGNLTYGVYLWPKREDKYLDDGQTRIFPSALCSKTHTHHE